MRWRAAMVLAPLLAGTAVADDWAWPGVPDALRTIREIISVRSLAPSDLPGLDDSLVRVPDRVITRLAQSEPDETPEVQRAVAHAFGAVAFARGPGAGLAKKWEIAFAMSSSDREEQARGIRILRREPFGRPLLDAIDALSKAESPVWRLGAARIAKLYTQLKGPDAVCAAIALRTLTDADPDVAVNFAHLDAYDFHDEKIVDAMIRALSDHRGRTPADLGYLRGGNGTVAQAVTNRLRGEFFFWRGWGGPTVSTKGRGGQSLRTIWRHKRTAGGAFGLDPARWRRVIDHRGPFRIGKPVRLDAPVGDYWLRLASYEESWKLGEPVFRADLVLSSDAAGKQVVLKGSHGWAQDGAFLRRLAPPRPGKDDPLPGYEAFLAPGPGDTLRVRFRYWEPRTTAPAPVLGNK